MRNYFAFWRKNEDETPVSLCYYYADTSRDNPHLTKRELKVITKERLAEAQSTGPKLCVDLSMTDCMSDKVSLKMTSLFCFLKITWREESFFKR